jgi:aminoglycoside phosphotransferase (APT) family kinase protein
MPHPPLREVDVDGRLVRALLREQHPDLADRPLVPAGAGWDNAMFRLGPDLAVRLPTRAAAAALVLHEQRWLSELAVRLPVAVPTPVRTGRPSARFGWAWSVVPWLSGTSAEAAPVAARTAWAADLARTLDALHVPAPADAPDNRFRGVPLARRDQAVRERFTGSVDAALLSAAWQDGLAAPPWHGPAVWLHGDPHPANLLVRADRLAALLDFGDLTSGDPASDLATAWLTFDATGRARFQAALPGVDRATWRRARAWAAALVPTLRAYPEQYPQLDAIGRHTTAQLAGSLQP